MKYYPAIFVLEPFHKEFLISLLIGKFLYLLQLILKQREFDEFKTKQAVCQMYVVH